MKLEKRDLRLDPAGAESENVSKLLLCRISNSSNFGKGKSKLISYGARKHPTREQGSGATGSLREGYPGIVRGLAATMKTCRDFLVGLVAMCVVLVASQGWTEAGGDCPAENLECRVPEPGGEAEIEKVNGSSSYRQGESQLGLERDGGILEAKSQQAGRQESQGALPLGACRGADKAKPPTSWAGEGTSLHPADLSAFPVSADSSPENRQSKTFPWFRGQVETALKIEGKTDPKESLKQAGRLLELYLQIRDAPTLSPSQKQSLLRPLETRLRRMARSLRAELNNREPPPAYSGGNPPCLPNGRAAPSAKESEDSLANRPEAHRTLSGHPEPGTFGGPQGMPEYGWELVELIEQVVSPHTWARNGGKGEIWYWAPGRALVVRQTEEVHQQIEDLLNQLRRAW